MNERQVRVDEKGFRGDDDGGNDDVYRMIPTQSRRTSSRMRKRGLLPSFCLEGTAAVYTRFVCLSSLFLISVNYKVVAPYSPSFSFSAGRI